MKRNQKKKNISSGMECENLLQPVRLMIDRLIGFTRAIY